MMRSSKKTSPLLVLSSWLLLLFLIGSTSSYDNNQQLQQHSATGIIAFVRAEVNTTTQTVSSNITATITDEFTNTSTQEITASNNNVTQTRSEPSDSEPSAVTSSDSSSASESKNATRTPLPPTSTPTKSNSSAMTESNGDASPTDSKNGTESRPESLTRSHNGTSSKELSETKTAKSGTSSHSEIDNSTTPEQSLTNSVSKPSASDTFTLSESASETVSANETPTHSPPVTRSNSSSESTSQTRPSNTMTETLESTPSQELSESTSESVTQNTNSETETYEQTPSVSETRSNPSESSTPSQEPTTTHEATATPSLSFTTFSDSRLVLSRPLPRDGALGFTATHAPELEFEAAPALRVNGSSRWEPARKIWPKDFDRSKPERRCRAYVADVKPLVSSSTIKLPAGCGSNDAERTITSASIRVLPKTDVVPAAFGGCRFDAFTIDWIPEIAASCIQKTIASTKSSASSAGSDQNNEESILYRTPPMNVTVRFCLNTSNLATPVQHLPRQEEMCLDSWTVLNACPLSRENLLYTVDQPIRRLQQLTTSSSSVVNNFDWIVEGTWFHPESKVSCRVTDTTGVEVLRQPAQWIDTCHISCRVNDSMVARMQAVTRRHTTLTTFPINNINNNFVIASADALPGFAGSLSLERDGYLFVSACPGLTAQTVNQLNEDALSSGVNCRFTQDQEYRIHGVVTTSKKSRTLPSGCPIRLIGRPAVPSFYPPSGTILAPVIVSDNSDSVLAVLSGTVEVTFCDFAGNRAFLEDATVGPKSLSSVVIDKTTTMGGGGGASSSGIVSWRNQTSTAVFFTNTTFIPVTASMFGNSSAKCSSGQAEDIPLVFNPPDYFGWTMMVETATTTTAAATTAASPSGTTAAPSSEDNKAKIVGQIAYCVTYDADIPTNLHIDNLPSILTVGDTDVGMPVLPIVSATNRIGKFIRGSVVRFRVRIRAELLVANPQQQQQGNNGNDDPASLYHASGVVYDDLVRQFPIEVPVRFNSSGTGFGLRISLVSGGNTTSSIILWGSQYPREKNISVSFCTTTGNPPPFVQTVLAEYPERKLCGASSPISLYDSIYQNSTSPTTVTVFGGSFPYIKPVYCQFSSVDNPWSFTLNVLGPGVSEAKVISSCKAECVIPPQKFPIRALSAFAFNTSGSWVSTRTLSSPPGMLRLKVGTSWIGPISMDVYGRAASLVLLSFTQNRYIRLQTTILVPITVTVADAATNSLADLDDTQRVVHLGADEGTAMLLNGTSQLQGSAPTCSPKNGVATLRGITFINPQAGEYTLRVSAPGLENQVSTAVTLRNPDPNFNHYLRFGGKTPPLRFTDPSNDGTSFGTFPVKLHVEACVRGTTVPDKEVSGFGVIVRIVPLDPRARTPTDKARGIGLTGCEPTFGNCHVSERGVVTFSTLRFFGEPGKSYNLTISMSNVTLDVYPLSMVVHTPQCDVGGPDILSPSALFSFQEMTHQQRQQNAKRVIPERMSLNVVDHSGGSSSSKGIEVRGKYFPIPETAFSGWLNESELDTDRYYCSFAGGRFPAMFVDSCTVRCFVNDFSFFAQRKLVNGTGSSSIATTSTTTTMTPFGPGNMTLPSNISLCQQQQQHQQGGSRNRTQCCFDNSTMRIVCSEPVASLVKVILPERFQRLLELEQQQQSSPSQSAGALKSIDEGGFGTLFVVGAPHSATISQIPTSRYKIFKRDQVVPVDPRAAEVRLDGFDLLIVDAIGQEIFNFDVEAGHHVVLESITRRGKPQLNLPANWSSVLKNTVPSPFVRQEFPGNCLERIPGSMGLYNADPSVSTEIYRYSSPPPSGGGGDGDGGGGGGGGQQNNGNNATDLPSSSSSSIAASSSSTATTSTVEVTTMSTASSPSTSAPSSSDISNNNNGNGGFVPIVANISGIKPEGWITANGSLRIEDLVFHRPSAGTYDITFRVDMGSNDGGDSSSSSSTTTPKTTTATTVLASFSLHIVGGEPTDICLWTFGGQGLRNPLAGGLMQPQPMFMFLDAAGNIYQPLRQNPNLTNYLDLIDENFVRSVKEVPVLLFRPKDFVFESNNDNNASSANDTTTTSGAEGATTALALVPAGDNNNNNNNNNQRNPLAGFRYENVSGSGSDTTTTTGTALTYEIPELEFIEPQGIGLLTFMYRSFSVQSNFSYDFMLEFRSQSRIRVPEYWRRFNKSIFSPIFESQDCPVTDFALPEKSECRGCPSGPKACIGSIFPFCFICNGTTTSLVEKNYWRFAPESTVAYFCSRSTCLGPSVLGQCDERSIPHSPMCQVCSPGYSKALDGGCADCGERWVSVVIVIVTVIVVTVVVALIVTASLRAHEASSSSSVVIFSKIFVNFLQVLGMLGEFGVGFPGFVKATLMGVSIGSGAAGIGLNPIYCLFPDFTFFHTLVLHLVLPAVTLVILAAILLLLGWLKTRRYRRKEQAKLRRAAQLDAAEAAIGTAAAHVNLSDVVDDVPVEEDNQIMNLFDTTHNVSNDEATAGEDEAGTGEEMKTRPNFGGGGGGGGGGNGDNADDDADDGDDALRQEATTNDIPPSLPDAPSSDAAAAAADAASEHGAAASSPGPADPSSSSSPIASVDNRSILSSTFRSFSNFKSFFLKKDKNNNEQDGGGGDGSGAGGGGGGGGGGKANAVDGWSDDDEFSDADLDAELEPPPPLFQGRIFLTCAIIIMFLLYQSILTQTVDTFRCDVLTTTDSLPQISFMQADPRVPCIGDLYERIISIAAWGLFLYGTVVPLASLIAILHTARHQGWSVANEFFAFLINGFRLECWYWELVIVFRKVVIRVLLATVEDDMLQALLGVWFLTAMFIIHAYRSPYVRSLHNNAESLSLLTTIMVLNFGMLLQRTQEMTQEVCGLTCRGLSYVLVLVLLFIVLFFCANIVRSFYDHLIEVLGVDRPDGRKVIVWRNVKRAVKGAVGGEENLPHNFSTYVPPVLEPHVAEMLGTAPNQSDTPPK